MKILFLHEVNYLTKPIFEMHEIPENMAALGHEVLFLHFPESSSRAEIRGIGREATIRGRALPASSIKLLNFSRSGTFVSRLIISGTSFYHLTKLLLQKKPNVVVSYAVPTFGWQCAIICRIFSVPFVYRAIDVSHLIRPTKLFPLVRIAERIIVRLSTLVSVNNSALLSYLEKLPGKKAPIEVHFPPLADEMFSSNKPSDCQVPNPEEQTVVFMGTLFNFTGLDSVIESLASSKLKNIHLHILGDGPELCNLMKLSESLNTQNRVKFFGRINFRDLPIHFEKAQVLINPFKPIEVTNFAFPNKVLQYLASGKPVVSTKLEGLFAELGSVPNIIWVENPSQVWSEVEKVITKRQECIGNRQVVSETLSYLRLKFSTRIAIERFEATLLELAHV